MELRQLVPRHFHGHMLDVTATTLQKFKLVGKGQRLTGTITTTAVV